MLLYILESGDFMMDYYEANDEPIKTLDMNGVLSNTFFIMFLGLLASAVTATFAYYLGLYIPLKYLFANSISIWKEDKLGKSNFCTPALESTN